MARAPRSAYEYANNATGLRSPQATLASGINPDGTDYALPVEIVSGGTGGGASGPVDVTDRAARLVGHVAVDNLPSVQPVSGSVSVSNLPATQPVSGSVAVSNFPAFPASQVVTGTVNVGNFPGTQPVSGTVEVNNFPATQPISGVVSVSNFPGTQAVSGPLTDTQLRASAVPVSGPLTDAQLRAAVVPTRDAKDTARTNVAIYAEAVAGATSEALITTSQSKAYAAPSTGTSYAVTAGKTLRITSITIAWIATTTTANTTRIRLRVNPSGAALVNSPIAWSIRVAWESATFIANEGETITIPLPDGIEIPGGGGVAVTHQEAAANGSIDCSLACFEY